MHNHREEEVTEWGGREMNHDNTNIKGENSVEMKDKQEQNSTIKVTVMLTYVNMNIFCKI